MGSVTLNSFRVPGIVMEVRWLHPEARVKRTHRWGVKGESEIRSAPGGRNIEIRILIHNSFRTYSALARFLETLDNRVLDHGKLLVDTGAYRRTFVDVTFDGFIPDHLQSAGPVPDVGNGLGEGAGRWWIQGMLQFRQLTVNN